MFPNLNTTLYSPRLQKSFQNENLVQRFNPFTTMFMITHLTHWLCSISRLVWYTFWQPVKHRWTVITYIQTNGSDTCFLSKIGHPNPLTISREVAEHNSCCPSRYGGSVSSSQNMVNSCRWTERRRMYYHQVDSVSFHFETQWGYVQEDNGWSSPFVCLRSFDVTCLFIMKS